MRRWTLALLAASASAASACSLLVNTDGYAKGAAADGDGGSTDGAKDAASDGTPPDGGAPSDAGTDARFCALNAGAALCLDFDDGGDVGSYFSDTKLDPRVTRAITSGAFPTPSLSFDFAGGTLANGFLETHAAQQLLVKAQKSVSVSARLLVDRADTVHNVRALEVAMVKNGGFISFFVHPRTTQSTLYSQIYGTDGGYQSTNDVVLTTAIPVGKPVRVEIQIDATQNPGKALVLLDGQVASLPITFDPQLVIGAAPEIAVHLTSYDNPGDTLAATTFHVDDLLVVVQ